MKTKEILEKGPLPCPFCGKTDVSVNTASVDINFDNPTMQVYSHCNHCGTKSPYTKVISSLTPDDVVTAIGYELWNKRAITSSKITVKMKTPSMGMKSVRLMISNSMCPPQKKS